MGEVMALNGMHTSDVTCVGFSDSGNYIITGDELGKVQLWDEDGEPITTDINVNEEITGCDFSNSDAKFAVATTSGNIYLICYIRSASAIHRLGGKSRHYVVDK